jgi:surface polysaccharide O-acyltransferase-like enzyme
MSTTRISSIDFIRVLAIFAVILMHTRSFAVYTLYTVILNQSARFAVPFFFIIAGYLFGKKLNTGKSLDQISLSYGSRILWIFLFWSFVYLLLPLLSPKTFTLPGFSETIKSFLSQNFINILKQLKAFLFVGTKYHLWFLSSLIQSLLIAVVLIKLKLRAYFIPIALSLYVFGLIAGSYSTTPIGLSVNFDTKHGPILGTIFFAIGLYLSESRESFSLTFAIILTLLGFLLHFLEIFVLWHFYNVSPLRHDFLLGTVLFGTGVALIALAKPSLGKNLFITQFGPYMLGVYVVHVAFVEYLSAFRFKYILWGFVFPIVVFIASLLTTVILTKFRLLRKFII